VGTMRAWTTFGVGTSPREGRTLQPLPDSVKGINTLDVPGGANPSKVATWVQRLATDGVLADECPEELHDAVHLGSLSLTSDPSKALAIDMSGNPIGDKMLQRLEATEGEKAWLLFGLTPAE
jgi:hypothetical protein